MRAGPPPCLKLMHRNYLNDLRPNRNCALTSGAALMPDVQYFACFCSIAKTERPPISFLLPVVKFNEFWCVPVACDIAAGRSVFCIFVNC